MPTERQIVAAIVAADVGGCWGAVDPSAVVVESGAELTEWRHVSFLTAPAVDAPIEAAKADPNDAAVGSDAENDPGSPLVSRLRAAVNRVIKGKRAVHMIHVNSFTLMVNLLLGVKGDFTVTLHISHSIKK